MLRNACCQTLLALLLGLPTIASAVVLNPGNVGDFFLWSSTGTVNTLDSNAFAIEFADEKYITITPYEVDAEFLFGIDFDGVFHAA